MTQKDKPKTWLTLSRLWDVLAILVIGFVIWRWFVAPHVLDKSKAYPAPHLTYKLLDGGSYSLAAHRGHIIFLDFWASWCDPCKAELPMIEAFARKHPEVDVIPVDVAETPLVVASFAKQYHLSNVALDPKGLSQGYFQLDGFPTVVAIDPQGQIRASWQGYNAAIALNMSNALAKLKKT